MKMKTLRVVPAPARPRNQRPPALLRGLRGAAGTGGCPSPLGLRRCRPQSPRRSGAAAGRAGARRGPSSPSRLPGRLLSTARGWAGSRGARAAVPRCSPRPSPSGASHCGSVSATPPGSWGCSGGTTQTHPHVFWKRSSIWCFAQFFHPHLLSQSKVAKNSGSTVWQSWPFPASAGS